MIGSDDEGDYSLEISPVALEDDAVFQCQVGAVDGVLGIRSRSAKFTVQVPPEPPVIVVTHAFSHAQVYKSSDINYNVNKNGDGEDGDDQLMVAAASGDLESNSNEDNDHHLRTTAGLTIELTCEAHGGRPPAELTWMDSSGNAIIDGVSYSTTKLDDGKRWNAALKWIVVASRSLDGQRVTCRSENAALKSPRYAHIQLEVRYAPEVNLRIASVSETDMVREGDDLTLECNAIGNPSRMTFKWSRDGQSLGNEGDVGASGDGTPRLVFRRVGKEFHGTTIVCEVTNSVGTSRAKIAIKVAFKPRFIKLPEAVIGIARSENTQLQCNVDSFPAAKIRWSKFVPKLSNNLVIDQNGMERRIEDHWTEIGEGQSIKISTAGRYRCLVKNEIFDEELRGDTLVFIKGPPLIRNPSIQYGIENEPVRLQCIVEAVPPPTKISWFKMKPYQQILGVDNNEGYEILEEEDPEDFNLYQSSLSSSYLTSSMLELNSQSSSSSSSSIALASKRSKKSDNDDTTNNDNGVDDDDDGDGGGDGRANNLFVDDVDGENQLSHSSLALLRSIIYIRRAKDSDFGQYNCSVWNQYGFQSQIITLEKQSKIISPLVLTLSGIICFGVILALIASLLVFVCIRSQRLNHDHTLVPKKLDPNDSINRQVCLSNLNVTCNGVAGVGDLGSVTMTDAGQFDNDYKIATFNSLEKNVLMTNTIMKLNGSNKMLTTTAAATTTATETANDSVSSSNNGARCYDPNVDMIGTYLNNRLNLNEHGSLSNGYSNLYDPYSYNQRQQQQLNNGNNHRTGNHNGTDLIIANGNMIANERILGNGSINSNLYHNYDNMVAYQSQTYFLPPPSNQSINDYDTALGTINGTQSMSTIAPPKSQEIDKNKVSISNYFHQQHSDSLNLISAINNHHVYSTVKKNQPTGTAVTLEPQSNDIDQNKTSKTTSLSNSSTNYATLLSPANGNGSNCPNEKLIDQSDSHSKLIQENGSSQPQSKLQQSTNIANSHLHHHHHHLHSYPNNGKFRLTKGNEAFVNPYVRTDNNVTMVNGSIPLHNGLASMNHYSNVENGVVSDALSNGLPSLANGDRMLNVGVYSTTHQHNRYKTNSLGGGSSSSGVISTGGSSPGHSSAGSVSGSNNPNGTHV
ncbi:Irregular chiasm C-roughest protein [Sarcoptes scabiei]|uniref:Irregular chiasm C-roughest protein n=1 Tax=Sarcoptes scabiei TaxID=52283 RepID=A0A834R0L5_SARSC|nr:Irregular chiasm C-roughest protein [Sarcoptes scabiei]